MGEVLTVGAVQKKKFEGLAAAEAKLRHYCAKGEAGASSLNGVDAAFCIIGDGRMAPPDDKQVKEFAELCKAAEVQHVSLLSSFWADSESKTPFAAARRHHELAEVFVSCGFPRLSIFRPALVALPAGPPEDAAPMEKAFYHAFPTVRQFMPSKFREVSLDDLILAMRLNAELCDPTEPVERLDFTDMMQIIGKEDTI